MTAAALQRRFRVPEQSGGPGWADGHFVSHQHAATLGPGRLAPPSEFWVPRLQRGCWCWHSRVLGCRPGQVGQELLGVWWEEWHHSQPTDPGAGSGLPVSRGVPLRAPQSLVCGRLPRATWWWPSRSSLPQPLWRIPESGRLYWASEHARTRFPCGGEAVSALRGRLALSLQEQVLCAPVLSRCCLTWEQVSLANTCPWCRRSGVPGASWLGSCHQPSDLWARAWRPPGPHESAQSPSSACL